MRYEEAIEALPDRTRARLAGPLSAVPVADGDGVAWAGHARRAGERGLLVISERTLVFAPETGGVDQTPLDRLTLAVPRETILTVGPGTGGRREDEFRPLTPASFAGVAWPPALTAASGPRASEGTPGRTLALTLAVLLAVAVIIAAVLLLA